MPRTATADRVDCDALLEFLRPRHGERTLLPPTARKLTAGPCRRATRCRCISGEQSDWADYRAAMQRQGESLVRITVTGAGADRDGWFPVRTRRQGLSLALA